MPSPLQFHLNGGHPVAMSIPATEHSVMTSWRTEQAAMENMVEQFGTGLYAIVMDSYDYAEVDALWLFSGVESWALVQPWLPLAPDTCCIAASLPYLPPCALSGLLAGGGRWLGWSLRQQGAAFSYQLGLRQDMRCNWGGHRLLGLTPASAAPVANVQALSSLLPAVAEKKLDKGGFLVLRPDSGVPACGCATGKRLQH